MRAAECLRAPLSMYTSMFMAQKSNSNLPGVNQVEAIVLMCTFTGINVGLATALQDVVVCPHFQ